MANVEKISVALPPEMAKAMRQVVESGDYASASEVMREWQARRVERNLAMLQVGQLWDEGLESGEPGDGEAAFARIRRALDINTGKGGSACASDLPREPKRISGTSR